MANEIQQPKPYDLVGNPILMAGIGSRFEAKRCNTAFTTATTSVLGTSMSVEARVNTGSSKFPWTWRARRPAVRRGL